MEEKITAWITRYALTDGIEKVKGEINQARPSEFCYGERNFATESHWHLTEQAAVYRVVEMRDKKVKSLEKQIAKMRALNIQVVDKTK